MVVMEQDVASLLGLVRVVITNLPVAVCEKCGPQAIDGGILETVAMLISAEMLSRAELDAMEVKFLRKRLGYTQEDLALHLGVDRVTVNRWEAGPSMLSGPAAYAIRSHALICLERNAPALFRQVRRDIIEPPTMTSSKPGYHSFNGAQFASMAA